jgi:biotin carboxyl carrier protein
MKENDPVAMLEAMKMEMPVAAPAAGFVKEINLNKVTSDTILMIRQ